MTALATTLDLDKFALTIVSAYRRMAEAERPSDKKTTAAEFLGLCKAADALGLAMTPAHRYITAMDVFNTLAADRGPRPRFQTMNTQPLCDWDALVIAALVAKMGWAS